MDGRGLREMFMLVDEVSLCERERKVGKRAWLQRGSLNIK